MSATLTAAEVRALNVAYRDLVERVTWADSFEVTIAPLDADALEVTFVRTVAAGSPTRRGGGIEAGVTYRVTAGGAIERIGYPR